MKKYNVRAESSVRYYFNYFYDAESEEDAINQFLKAKNSTKKRYKRIWAECSN